MAKAPTSYIQTTGAARTRTVDVLSFTRPIRPQALTVYLRFREQGAIATGATVEVVVSLGGAANGLEIRSNGNVYTLHHFERGGEVSAALAAGPTIGATVELVGQMSATGAVTLHQSINGATATSSTASAARPLAAAWDSGTLQLGARVGPSFSATVAYRDVLVVRGVHDMVTMRTRAGQ